MKRKTIAFLYNVRHRYPNSNDFRTHLEADFDDPKTIEAMIGYFKKGYQVIPIEADEKAYLKLYRYQDKINLAFNYAEGIYGSDREAHLPAMLEMLSIPYTGSKPLTMAIGLNKAAAKQILLANNIPTLPFQVWKTPGEKLSDSLHFPLIVKPVSQGSSAGITNNSVVANLRQLKKQVLFVNKIFNQPALVEPFLSGREFSVALLGNPPQILPIIEADHSLLPAKYQPLDSLEVKWLYEEQSASHHLLCPAKMDKKLFKKVKDICLKTFKALDIYDYCRIDLRCDLLNNPYVLEINSPPGLIPPEVSQTSYFPLMARQAGIDYFHLLQKIINLALARYQH